MDLAVGTGLDVGIGLDLGVAQLGVQRRQLAVDVTVDRSGSGIGRDARLGVDAVQPVDRLVELRARGAQDLCDAVACGQRSLDLPTGVQAPFGQIGEHAFAQRLGLCDHRAARLASPLDLFLRLDPGRLTYPGRFLGGCGSLRLCSGEHRGDDLLGLLGAGHQDRLRRLQQLFAAALRVGEGHRCGALGLCPDRRRVRRGIIAEPCGLVAQRRSFCLQRLCSTRGRRLGVGQEGGRLLLRVRPDLSRGVASRGDHPGGLLPEHRRQAVLVELLGAGELLVELLHPLAQLGVTHLPDAQRIGGPTQHGVDLGRFEPLAGPTETGCRQRRGVDVWGGRQRVGHATMLRARRAPVAHAASRPQRRGERREPVTQERSDRPERAPRRPRRSSPRG